MTPPPTRRDLVDRARFVIVTVLLVAQVVLTAALLAVVASK